MHPVREKDENAASQTCSVFVAKIRGLDELEEKQA